MGRGFSANEVYEKQCTGRVAQRLSERIMKDHYKTLQVSRNADSEVIERAYKVLSRKYHPDMNSESERSRANRRMQRLNEAYSVLRDPARRKRYDDMLPAEGAQAWDVFWERGLVGMFVERFMPRR